MIALLSRLFTEPLSLPTMRYVKNYRTIGKPIQLRLALLLAVAVLATSACGSNWFWGSNTDGNGASLSNVTMLNVDMYDSYYGNSDTNMSDPPVWSIPAGSDVVVNLVNHGSYDHNWAIVKKGVTVPVPYEEGQAGDIILHGIGMVYNNSQTTITFSAPDLGEYQVICTVSGHYPFMQGRLLVTDGNQ